MLLETYSGHAGLSLKSLAWMFKTADFPAYYIPVSWLAAGAFTAALGHGALAFHSLALVFHAANSAAAFFLIREILRRSGGDAAESRFGAFVGALCWALHPMRVEVVAFASAWAYAVAAFFGFICVLLYLRSGAAPSPAARRRLFIASLAAFVAAIFSYPLAITVFPALLVADFCLLGRTDWRRALLEKLPFAAAALAMAAISAATRRASVAMAIAGALPTLKDFGLLDRALQALYIWAHFVFRPLWPFGLSPVYTRLVWWNPWHPVFIFSALFVPATTLLLWRARRRRPGLLGLWLCHLLVLTPALGLHLHPHFASDRYSYIQGILWGILAGAGAMKLAKQSQTRPAVAALCLALAALSFRQAGLWRDDQTLLEGILARLGKDRYAADIHARLAQDFLDRADGPKAESHAVAALQIDPSTALASRVLGILALSRGDARGAEQLLTDAITARPTDWTYWNDRGVARLQLKNLAGAESDFIESLKRRPTHADALLNLGLVRRVQGRAADADGLFRKALAIRPTLARQLEANGIRPPN